MAGVFEKLSAELLLILADTITQLPEPLRPEPETEEDERKLAAEKAIIGRKTLLNLSATSRAFRTALAPQVYRILNLHNSEDSASYVHALARGPNAHHVKHLNVIGTFKIPDELLCDDLDAEEYRDVDNCLSPKADDVLRDLTCFPHLEKLVLELDFVEDNGSWWSACTEHGPEEEDREQEEQREGEWALWAWINKTFDAISSNEPGVITNFSYRNAPIRGASCWRDDKFRLFLNHLREFEISICGGDNGAGWQINTQDIYLDFFAKLRPAFIEHLTNVTIFKIGATNDGPIGGTDYRQAPMPLEPNDLPALREIYLEEVFLDTKLLAFLEGHAPNLTKISMCHVWGACLDGCVVWSDFWKALLRADPKELREVQIDYGTDHWRPEQYSETMTLRPGQRMWPYMYVDDKYGMIFADEDEMVARFTDGDDHQAWVELNNRIEDNNRQA